MNVPRIRPLSSNQRMSRNNMNNMNNNNFNNFQPICWNNFMNNMNQNINIAMSHDNFNNFGGVGRNNFQMNNNMNQMNQMCFGNQMNNMNIMNDRYNMNNNINNMNNIFGRGHSVDNSSCNNINNNFMNFNMNNFMNNNINNNNVNNNMNINEMNNRNNRFMNNNINNNMNINGMNNRMNCNMNNNMNNRQNNFLSNGMNNQMNNCMNNNFNQMNNIKINQKNNFIKPIMNNQNKNNFAFPFRQSFSNEINEKNTLFKNNIRIINEPIKMNFSFQTGQKFDVYGKTYERLSEVINRFKNECPDELKKYLSSCICNGKPADINNTLSELEIKNGHNILFVKNKNENKEYKLTKIEEKKYNKFRGEFFALKILNSYENNRNQLNSNELKNYSSFYNSKDKSHSISVKEHPHLLVYCLTNFDWICNLCKIKYEKNNGKYYCSKCDFDICENCHYHRNYVIKKSFPKNTYPSNSSVNTNYLETDLHEHKLVYCRTSKNLAFFNDWSCDNCCANYKNKIWSFYCTLCNYHLCLKCCGYK